MTLEFISAQIHIFIMMVTINSGFFQFLGSITIIPIYLKHPLGISFLPSINIHLSSLVWINLSSLHLYGWIDWYGPILYGSQKVQVHRERDEVTFHQRDVKEIYDHYLTQLATYCFFYLL